eukprot:CAMPEP_0201487848 /NCGR_PEP_ID=MMETSP0151_2-20130828/15683_1 /ASSEMBLY_ACC=CAM_ASM_000257 /TAXON_ID=200890 /ORGANISM="Paramoeba atlantica, Strain 621/1 / CCAP 1560/9" /LENGTH=163 /DNA_ID=CAMNT_0047873003 /DNA_START=28 /DNA_END=519 /DNA_ORIENTATION=-
MNDSLMNAIFQGDLNLVKSLLPSYEENAKKSQRNELTPLHYAAVSGQTEIVDFLLEKGADVNAARNNNFFPLHSAAMKGHASICQKLIEKGASPNVQTNPQGYSPCHSAAWAGHTDAVMVLVKAGTDLSLRNYHNDRPIDTAQKNGHVGTVSALQAAGCSLSK